MDNKETYEGESGFLSDYDCTVTESWFATDSNYNNGQTTLLFWRTTTNNPETPETEDRWACGAQWESFDGGETVEHPAGKHKFNHASQVQKLVRAAVEAGAGPVLEQRGPAQQSNVWTGLRFHMERITDEYTIQGEKRTREILLPTAFLGTDQDTVDRESEELPSVVESIDPALLPKLQAIKGETSSHSQFIDRVIELPEVAADASLIVALGNEQLWKEL